MFFLHETWLNLCLKPTQPITATRVVDRDGKVQDLSRLFFLNGCLDKAKSRLTGSGLTKFYCRPI